MDRGSIGFLLCAFPELSQGQDAFFGLGYPVVSLQARLASPSRTFVGGCALAGLFGRDQACELGKETVAYAERLFKEAGQLLPSASARGLGSPEQVLFCWGGLDGSHVTPIELPAQELLASQQVSGILLRGISRLPPGAQPGSLAKGKVPGGEQEESQGG